MKTAKKKAPSPKKNSKKIQTQVQEERELAKAVTRSLDLTYLSKMAESWVAAKQKDRIEEKGTDAVLNPKYKGPLPTPKKLARTLAIHYARIQKERVRFGNAIIAFHKAGLPVTPLALNYSMFKRYEVRLKKILQRMGEAHPVWDLFLKDIKGFGGFTAALLFSVVNIRTFARPRDLIRFAGFATTDGLADRKKKGEQLKYHPDLKVALWRAGKFLMMAKEGTYRPFYVAAKERYQKLHPVPQPALSANGVPFVNYTKQHIHMMSLRKMMIRFLIDLFKVWRTQEGLPVPPSWEEREAMEKAGTWVKKEVPRTAPEKEGEKVVKGPKRKKTPIKSAPEKDLL